MANSVPGSPGPLDGGENVDGGTVGSDGQYPQWGRLFNSDSKHESPWARKIVLALDGGGVRGYASLKILERLMSKIEEIEKSKRPDYPAHHSSATYSWCDENAVGPFKLHHYVDYFVGTSTGGLSAIMLGRLQSTVDQALQKYDDVGRKVFNRPRPLHLRGVLAPRFVAKYMEKELKKATVSAETTRNNQDMSKKAVARTIDIAADTIPFKNSNPGAAQTVVTAFGGGAVQGPYLFRSYEHAAMSVKSKGNTQNLHLNPGPASDVPVWQVGRATSAAPTYFSPMVIRDEEYMDGGMAQANNPIQIAYTEVTQMHPAYEPAIVISVGTGIKTTKKAGTRNRARELLPNIKDTLRLYKIWKRAILESENIHLRFQGDIDRRNASGSRTTDPPIYWRFNVSEENGIGHIKLGEWEGDEGKGRETKGKMNEPIDAYLKVINDDLKECAQQLVDIRRRREKTARWERFALDQVYYICPRSERSNTEYSFACKDLIFDTRGELRQHAIESHGFLSQVKCIQHHDDATLGRYACYWDHCEESVRVFEGESPFLDHMRGTHKIGNAQIKNIPDFEEWLDDGRRYADRDAQSRAPTMASQRGAANGGTSRMQP